MKHSKNYNSYSVNIVNIRHSAELFNHRILRVLLVNYIVSNTAPCITNTLLENESFIIFGKQVEKK